MIDYDLAKEIGATHVMDGKLHKFEGLTLYHHQPSLGWFPSHYQPLNGLRNGSHSFDDRYEDIKRINFDTQPQTKVEFVKCEFDLVGECVQDVYNNPNLYFFFNSSSGEFQIADYSDSAWHWRCNNIYRRIETPITWREQAADFIHSSDCVVYPYTAIEYLILESKDKELEHFINLCKIVAEANK